MSYVATKILRRDAEVDARLAQLQLHRPGLLAVRATALGAAADATDFHPANAPGTLAYQHGTFALRASFSGAGWLKDRPGGVEVIRNDRIMVQVAFANVDVACNDAIAPKPRSDKGAGAERLCEGNLFGEPLPQFTKAKLDPAWRLFYLMVAPDGAVELSQPRIEGRTFASFVERIYLSDGSDFTAGGRLPLDEDDDLPQFDPKVVRR